MKILTKRFWCDLMKVREESTTDCDVAPEGIIDSLVERGAVLKEYACVASRELKKELKFRVGSKTEVSPAERPSFPKTAVAVVELMTRYFDVSVPKQVVSTDLDYELKRRARDVARRLANVGSVMVSHI